MYCPRCGHQPISDAIRFCYYCGFKLGVVKASLADDDESSMTVATIQVIPKAPRQRDMNIGVILMFAGAMLAAFVAGRGGAGREGGALLLAISFASILLLSRPILKLIYKLLSWEEPSAHSFSLNQRGLAFGSMLMFAGTIFLAISSLLMFGRMERPEFLFALIAVFVLLLVISKHLMRAVRYLVAADADVASVSAAHDAFSAGDAVSSPALSPGQDMPVPLFTKPRVTTAEILAPASVTEQTTNLLENK
jgi:hypothetical protein